MTATPPATNVFGPSTLEPPLTHLNENNTNGDRHYRVHLSVGFKI